MKPVDYIIIAIILVIVGIAIFVLIKNKGNTCSCCKKNGCCSLKNNKNCDKRDL